MTKRLEIEIDKAELAGFHEAARRQGLTLGEWAHRALVDAHERQLGPTAARKKKAIERALRLGHSTAEIGEILGDIEQGRVRR